MSIELNKTDQTDQIKDNTKLEMLKTALKLCFAQVTKNKMHIMDRIEFEYNGRHYVFCRDE